MKFLYLEFKLEKCQNVTVIEKEFREKNGIKFWIFIVKSLKTPKKDLKYWWLAWEGSGSNICEFCLNTDFLSYKKILKKEFHFTTFVTLPSKLAYSKRTNVKTTEQQCKWKWGDLSQQIVNEWMNEWWRVERLFFTFFFRLLIRHRVEQFFFGDSWRLTVKLIEWFVLKLN